MRLETFPEKTSTPDKSMIDNNQEIIVIYLQKRQQTTRYYGIPYKTITITETAVPFVPSRDVNNPMTATLYYQLVMYLI
ncbi:9549_t:CDS:1, partial [Racocetra persica]